MRCSTCIGDPSTGHLNNGMAQIDCRRPQERRGILHKLKDREWKDKSRKYTLFNRELRSFLFDGDLMFCCVNEKIGLGRNDRPPCFHKSHMYLFAQPTLTPHCKKRSKVTP
jgi:hypothetical protein